MLLLLSVMPEIPPLAAAAFVWMMAVDQVQNKCPGEIEAEERNRCVMSASRALAAVPAVPGNEGTLPGGAVALAEEDWRQRSRRQREEVPLEHPTAG